PFLSCVLSSHLLLGLVGHVPMIGERSQAAPLSSLREAVGRSWLPHAQRRADATMVAMTRPVSSSLPCSCSGSSWSKIRALVRLTLRIMRGHLPRALVH